jgi:hypothetical protein
VQHCPQDGLWRRIQMDVSVHQVKGLPAVFSGNVQVWYFVTPDALEKPAAVRESLS